MGFKLTAYVKPAAEPAIASKNIEVPAELAADLESAYQAWVKDNGYVVKAEFDNKAEVKTFFDQAHYWAYHRTGGRVRIRKITDAANSETCQVFKVVNLPTERETAYNTLANAKAALKKANETGDAAKIAAATTKLADAQVKAKAAGIDV